MLLTRYIIKELLQPFFLSLAVITFLLGIQYVLQLMDSVASKGLPLGVIIEILTLSLAWMFALSIPMSCLVAALMAFGRLSADREIVALKGAGVSPLKMMYPAIVISLVIMAGLMAFNNWVLPEANHRNAAILSSISRKKPQAFISSGQLIKDFPGIQIWIDKIDNDKGTLHGIKIFEFQRRGQPKIIYADYGMLEYQDMGETLLLYLFDGENHLPQGRDNKDYLRIKFNKQVFAVKNIDSEFKMNERDYRSDREMSVPDMLAVVKDAEDKYEEIKREPQLWKEIDLISQLVATDDQYSDSLTSSFFRIINLDTVRSLRLTENVVFTIGIDNTHSAELGNKSVARVTTFNPLFFSKISLEKVLDDERRRLDAVEKVSTRLINQKERLAQYLVEIHKKFSIPVACVVFILIGAPLGIMARNGGIGIGVLYSIFFFILYWACLTGGERLADKLFIPAWLGMWAPNMILGVAGIYMILVVTRDNFTGNSRIVGFFIGMKKMIRARLRRVDEAHN